MNSQNSTAGSCERLIVDGDGVKVDRYQVRLHLERYRFARQFVKGKAVLDIASGEGYGSNLLAKAGASTVTGVDIAEDAINHAAHRYQQQGLTFRVGNAQAIDLPDASVDVVVSFETIEHLPDYRAYLAEVRRVLRPGGIYLVSTPNRLRESPGFGPDQAVPNPFHIREFTREELLPVLSDHFAINGVYGQGLLHPIFAAKVPLQAWRTVQCCLHTLRIARFPIGHIGMWGVHQWAGLFDDPAYFLVVCQRPDESVATGQNAPPI